MGLFSTFLLAFLAGVLPACLWLFFWLKEDAAHPEPPKLILLTFWYGALSVPFALILQLLFGKIFGVGGIESTINSPFLTAFVIVGTWAFIEELVKYIAAWNGGLKRTITDEAVDVPIYMISAALGFAALENMFFLITPLLNGNFQEVLITTQLRFIGASLVHVASSALIGIFAGYSLFFMNSVRKRYIGAGFILATMLHGLFNLFIIKDSQNAFAGFLLIWIFIAVIIVLFEKIKRIKVNTINNVREKEKENTD